MVNFATPLWLFGLATLPLIWWLHRLRARGPEFLVAALFLWDQAIPPDGSGERLAKAEHSWWLRALIMTSLVLALSSPQWLSRTHRITVWVDDSLSMFTWEGNATRMQLGIDRLIAALRTHGADEAVVHSLSSPGLSLVLTSNQFHRWPEQLRAWLAYSRGEPRPPAAVQMTHNSEHWLVSDGASTGLAEWLQSAPVTRVLAVGQERVNAAIITLALRPALRTREALEGLVVVANTGPEPLGRNLVLRLGGQELLRKPLPLAPAASKTVEFELPTASEGQLQAELMPADALDLDDRLSVPIPTPVAVRLYGDCGRHLQTALRVHPRLRIVGADQVHDTIIVCTPEHPPRLKPALLFHRIGTPHPVMNTPYWTRNAGPLARLILMPDWLRWYPEKVTSGQSLPLLMATEESLINYDPTEPPWIEVLLDMEAPLFAQRPEYLALIDGLLVRVLGHSLLHTLNNVVRSSAPSHIAPSTLVPSSRYVAGSSQKATGLSSYLIALAGLLLIVDFWRLHKRHVQK